MKTQLRLVVFTAVIVFAISARAQVTYVNTDSSVGTVGLTGTAGTLGSATNTAIQTFSGFSGLSSISWTLTDSFFGIPATFNAYVAQWDVADSRITLGSLVTFGATDVSFNPIIGVPTNLTFTDTLTGLNPSQTYALLLSTTSAGPGSFVANVGTIPGGANAAFFGSGTAGYAATSALSGSFVIDLELPSSGTLFAGTAYTMSVDGTLAAVPEPKTAAAAIAALFVAALIGRRAWQRRKSVAIPVVA